MKLGKHDKRRRVYWDSCTFLAWITGETVWGQDVTDGMGQLVEQVYANQGVIITSVLTKTEILESNLTPDQKKKFAEVFGHRNVVLINLDQRVSDKAAVIRDYYKKPDSRTLSVPDSIHLATAIHYEADEFHTFDGAGKRKRPFDLLPLNGNVAGAQLRIMKPTFIAPPPPPTEPITPVTGPQIELSFDPSAPPVETVEPPSPTISESPAPDAEGAAATTEMPMGKEAAHTETPPPKKDDS